MTADGARAGRYVKQPTGYRAFIPAPLPPAPPLNFHSPMIALLAQPAFAIDTAASEIYTLPDADLFVAMYVRREAVLSSQIEGTQSSLDDVLAFEVDPTGQQIPQDVTEVVNYIRAMNFGLARLETLPLSLRLIREIHDVLMQGVRGATKQPGEFRTSQNWIGPGNVPLSRASFVPPPPAEMREALANLEAFLHDRDTLHPLIHCGLAHAQFETIHPFLDGNGRVGRLLITFLLYHRGVLHKPLLYLSTYLKAHRAEYYDRLTAIRERDDWEGWIRFFLRGVSETAAEATAAARAIVQMRDRHRTLVQEHGLGTNGLRLLDVLYHYPIVNVRFIEGQLHVAFVTANKLMRAMQDLQILEEMTGNKKNRRFRYTRYLLLFTEPELVEDQEVVVQTTTSSTDHDEPSRLV